MAEAFHSGFTALFVQTPDTKELSGDNLRRLRENLRLAEQMGAQIATVYGTDPAVQIAEYARVSGVTKIVMGRVNHKRGVFHRLVNGSGNLADRLISLTGNLDVYIIPDQQPLYKKRHRRILPEGGSLVQLEGFGKNTVPACDGHGAGFCIPLCGVQ